MQGRGKSRLEEVILTRPLCSLHSPQMGRKSVKSVLWVSADGLRVVDDKTKVGELSSGWREIYPSTMGCSSQGGLLDSAMCSCISLADCIVLIQDRGLRLFENWYGEYLYLCARTEVATPSSTEKPWARDLTPLGSHCLICKMKKSGCNRPCHQIRKPDLYALCKIGLVALYDG